MDKNGCTSTPPALPVSPTEQYRFSFQMKRCPERLIPSVSDGDHFDSEQKGPPVLFFANICMSVLHGDINSSTGDRKTFVEAPVTPPWPSALPLLLA